MSVTETHYILNNSKFSNEDNESNTQEFSIIDHTYQAASLSFDYIYSSLKYYGWSFVDSNWKEFRKDSVGHFAHEIFRDDASEVTNKSTIVFLRIIDSKGEKLKKYKAILSLHNNEIFDTENILHTFVENAGTCFGNCTALAKEIIKREKLLNVNELSAIESGEKFVKKSIKIQMIEQLVVVANCKLKETEVSRESYESEYCFTQEETKLLGGIVGVIKYESDVIRLKEYGLTFQDLSELNETDFSLIKELIINEINMSDVERAWEKGKKTRTLIFADSPDKKLQKPTVIDLLKSMSIMGASSSIFYIKKGKENSGEGLILPNLNLLHDHPDLLGMDSCEYDIVHANTNSLKSDIFDNINNLNNPDFAGLIMLSASNSQRKIGHCMFMEIDNKNKLYILYDNNRGFYQFSDLNSCIEGLQKNCQSNGYTSINLLPIIFH